MELKDLIIRVFSVDDIKDKHKHLAIPFIKKHHYSGKIAKYPIFWAYLLDKNDNLIGVMQLGTPSSRNTIKKYSSNGKLIELKRLCCIDDTPKNTESYFIGAVLRYLKKIKKYESVLSYADSEQGNTGVIYKATNFKLLGVTKQNTAVYHKGELIPTRTAYNKKLPLYEEIRRYKSKGLSYNVQNKPKYIYLYNLT